MLKPVKLMSQVALPVVFAMGGIAMASEWTVVPESSAVTMYATKQGMWITGVFEDFSASIDFDPADPRSGSIVGIVSTASVDTEDDQNDTYVLGYLNVGEYPESRFESTSIEKTADGYRANGELSLAGHTNPIALDFTFETAGQSPAASGHAKLTGTMTVNRFDFDIASEVDINTAGQDVIVVVELDLKL